MHVKTITKANDLFNQVVTLDQEIKSLERHADTLVDEDKTVKLHLGFETAIPLPESVPDSHNDIYYPGGFVQMRINPFTDMKQQFTEQLRNLVNKEPTEQKSYDLNNSEALYVLGALLSIKNDRRKALVNQLLEVGFNL